MAWSAERIATATLLNLLGRRYTPLPYPARHMLHVVACTVPRHVGLTQHGILFYVPRDWQTLDDMEMVDRFIQPAAGALANMLPAGAVLSSDPLHPAYGDNTQSGFALEMGAGLRALLAPLPLLDLTTPVAWAWFGEWYNIDAEELQQRHLCTACRLDVRTVDPAAS